MDHQFSPNIWLEDITLSEIRLTGKLDPKFGPIINTYPKKLLHSIMFQ